MFTLLAALSIFTKPSGHAANSKQYLKTYHTS